MCRKRRVFKCTRWSPVQSGRLLQGISDSGELLLLQANQPLVACRSSAMHTPATNQCCTEIGAAQSLLSGPQNRLDPSTLTFMLSQT